MSLEESAFERTIPGDAVAQDFESADAKVAMAGDGLPDFQEMGQQHVAPLDPATFVCMADTTRFVLRDHRSVILLSFEPDEVKREADGRWWVEVNRVAMALDQLRPATGWDRLQRVWYELARPDPASAELAQRLGRLGIQTEVVAGQVEVQPLRPKCRHYYRYKTDLPNNLDDQVIQRICAAQRDDNGLLLSVRDQRMQACELRVPRHAPTEQQLDQFDEEKIRLGRERMAEQEEQFDVEAALAAEEQK